MLPIPFQNHTGSISPTLFFFQIKQNKIKNLILVTLLPLRQEFSFHTLEAFLTTQKLTSFCYVSFLGNHSISFIFQFTSVREPSFAYKENILHSSAKVFLLSVCMKITCVCMKLVLAAMYYKYLKAKTELQLYSSSHLEEHKKCLLVFIVL